MTFEPPQEVEEKPKFNGVSVRLDLERLETFKSKCYTERLALSNVMRVLLDLFLDAEDIQKRVIMEVRRRWG